MQTSRGKAAARIHGRGCNDAPDQCGRPSSVDMAPKILCVPTCGEWKGVQICNPLRFYCVNEVANHHPETGGRFPLARFRFSQVLRPVVQVFPSSWEDRSRRYFPLYRRDSRRNPRSCPIIYPTRERVTDAF